MKKLTLITLLVFFLLSTRVFAMPVPSGPAFEPQQTTAIHASGSCTQPYAGGDDGIGALGVIGIIFLVMLGISLIASINNSEDDDDDYDD